MKSKLGHVALISLISLGLSACVINVGDKELGQSKEYWQVQQEKNRANLTKLSIGMTLDQVQTVMGVADFTEAHAEGEDESAKVTQVLFYRTQWGKSDGKTTKDECTPVVFKNAKLVGWGETAYSKV